MHDIGAAPDPVDDEHPGSGTRPQFKGQSLLRVLVLCTPRGRTRDDDLQIADLEEARFDMLFAALECRVDDGPQRLHEKVLQALGQNTSRSDRRSGSRSVGLHRAMPRVAFP